MLMIQFDHILSELLNLLFELIDLGLILLSGLIKYKIISKKILYGPEYGFIEDSDIINGLG